MEAGVSSTPFAFATLVTSDFYTPGALTLAAALRDVHSASHTPFHTLCLVTPETVDVATIKLLRRSFDAVVGVEVIAHHDRTGLNLLGRPDLDTVLSKLHIFRLTQYQKIIYLDADVLPIRPLSHLFYIEHEFSAVPDVGWPDIFNSGVLVITPGHEKFDQLQDLLKEKGSWDGADQGILNEWRGDNWNRLSFTYNTTPTAAYTYAPAYERFGSKISALHFIGPNKPWKEIPFRTPGINTATPPSGPPSTSAQPHQSYDYPSLVDRWFQVYDRHFRTPLHEPATELSVRRYAPAWEPTAPMGQEAAQDSGSGHADVMPSSGPLSLEELKRLALEGVSSSSNQPPVGDTSVNVGTYYSLPLEGRVDLMRPQAQEDSPTTPTPSNRGFLGAQSSDESYLLPTSDPSHIPPFSEPLHSQQPSHTSYQAHTSTQLHSYRDQPTSAERHHAKTLHDTPFIDHRWEQRSAKLHPAQQHGSTAPQATQVHHAKHHRSIHSAPTLVAESSHRKGTRQQRRQIIHGAHRDSAQPRHLQGSLVDIKRGDYPVEVPPQQQSQISHNRYHDLTQHQIARQKDSQHTTTAELRHAVHRGPERQQQHHSPSQPPASPPRPPSPPLLIWNPAYDPPPSEIPAISAFPTDTYYQNAWDQPYGRDLQEQHQYFDQQHTGPLPISSSELFFEPPPTPHIPSSLLRQGHYRNVTGDSDSPVPDPSKVKSIFTWETDSQIKPAPRRVFPVSESLTKIPGVAEPVTVPLSVKPASPIASPQPKVSPAVTPSPIHAIPDKLSYTNAWDIVPSIQKYASRLAQPPKASAPLPEDWRRHSGGSWDDRAEEASRDGDVEDEGDDEIESSEGEPEPVSEDEAPEVKAWRRRHSFIGREKTYRVRGVQTIPPEEREMAVQTTLTLQNFQPIELPLPSKADASVGTVPEPSIPPRPALPSKEKEKTRPTPSRALSPEKTSPIIPSTTSKEKTRRSSSRVFSPTQSTREYAFTETNVPARRPILTIPKSGSLASAIQRERSGDTSTPSSTGPVSPKEGQPLPQLFGNVSSPRLVQSGSLSGGSPLSAGSQRKAGRVWDPARGVDVFKRGSEEVLARFLRMGSFDNGPTKT